MLVLFLLSKISRPSWGTREALERSSPISPIHLLPNWTFPSGEGRKLSSGDATAKISYQTHGGQSSWRASMPRTERVSLCICASVRDKVQQPGDKTSTHSKLWSNSGTDGYIWKNNLSATQHICQQSPMHFNKNDFTRGPCWWVVGRLRQSYWLRLILTNVFTSAVPEGVK